MLHFCPNPWRLLQEGFQNISKAGVYSIVDAVFKSIEPLTNETRTVILLSIVALVILFIIEVLQYRGNLLERINRQPLLTRRILYAALIASILILGTWYASSQQAFIYFQF